MIFLLFCVLEYTTYSVFSNIPCIPPFRSTIPFHHSVSPPFHRIASTRYFDVQENAKRKANQCATKNWICQLHFIAPDTSPLEKKQLIFGRNVLSFRDQDVPRSQERQYSNNYEWFLARKKNIGSDFFE